MNRASAFGRGAEVTVQNSLSAVAYDIYKDKPQSVDLDKTTFEDFNHYNMYTPIPADAHFYASFSHLAGYSSAYYTYMWDLVIACDVFGQFDRQNLMAGDAPMRYRRVVVEPGGSVSANDIVKNFLGRPQSMTSFQQWMQEEFEPAPQNK